MSTQTETRLKLVQEVIENLHVLGRHVGPGREQFLCKTDLNHAQLKFLYFVEGEARVTIPHLVSITNTTPGAITQLVNGLIKEGFLERIHDEKDKRRVYIQFSREGKKKFTKVRKLHLKFLQSLFGVLTDQELKHMAAIEKKLITKLSVSA